MHFCDKSASSGIGEHLGQLQRTPEGWVKKEKRTKKTQRPPQDIVLHRRLVEQRAYRKLLAEARIELIDLLGPGYCSVKTRGMTAVESATSEATSSST